MCAGLDHQALDLARTSSVPGELELPSPSGLPPRLAGSAPLCGSPVALLPLPKWGPYAPLPSRARFKQSFDVWGFNATEPCLVTSARNVVLKRRANMEPHSPPPQPKTSSYWRKHGPSEAGVWASGAFARCKRRRVGFRTQEVGLRTGLRSKGPPAVRPGELGDDEINFSSAWV